MGKATALSVVVAMAAAVAGCKRGDATGSDSHQYLSSALRSLSEPVTTLIEPGKRVFIGFLIGAAIIGTIVWWLRLRQRCSLVSFLFPRSIWLHRSALLDYKLMFVRALIRAALLGPFVVSSLAVAVAVKGWLMAAAGPGPGGGIGRTVVAGLFTLCAFMAEDFARFLVHLLAHRIPLLWELHKVHHSAEVLTPFSVYRTHPIESVLMRAGAALGVGLVAGVFSWFFRGGVSGWSILGVEAVGAVWNLAGANLRHSHIWVSYGPLLEHILISPAQHQIHHSDNPHHHHRNCGSAFALWDWMFGTLYVTRGREPIRFGLQPEERNHDGSVASAMIAPMLAAGSRLLGPVAAAARRVALGGADATKGN